MLAAPGLGAAGAGGGRTRIPDEWHIGLQETVSKGLNSTWMVGRHVADTVEPGPAFAHFPYFQPFCALTFASKRC